MRNTNTPPTNPIQLIAKLDAILTALEERDELSVAAIAAHVGEPRSSVYRLIAGLEAAQLVEPGVRRGTYRLGLRLFRLGSRVVQRFDERQIALPVMERIHQATGETVFLCVRREEQAICIERIEGRRVQSLALRIGASLPLHAGAGPMALLAWDPTPDAARAYAAGHALERYTDRTLATADQLRGALEEIRRQGYAISDGDVTPGVAAVGAPIFDHTHRVRAALSISGTRDAILGTQGERITELIVDGALQISRALGCDTPAASAVLDGVAASAAGR